MRAAGTMGGGALQANPGDPGDLPVMAQHIVG